MDNNDKKEFAEIFNALSEMYSQKEKPSILQMRMTFAALERFSIEQVKTAINKHIARGKFYPKPADLIEILEGTDITVDQIVASAKLANTPMGILARIHIGTHDLNNQDSFYLRQRAEECMQMIPEWKARAEQGQYSNHEISIMLKHDVSPVAPFAFGLSSPINSDQITARIEQIKTTKAHAIAIAPPQDYDEKPEGEIHPNLKALIDKIIPDDTPNQRKTLQDVIKEQDDARFTINVKK